jgi:putative ABC transport system permease protein
MGAALLCSLLRRFSLRHWRLAPGQSALLLLILALGVGVFTAIRLANRAAVASFTIFTEAVAGQSDWIVRGPAGDLPQDTLRLLQQAIGELPATLVPMLEVSAARVVPQGEAALERPALRLVGLDLIGIQNLNTRRGAERPLLGQAEEAELGRGPEAFWAGWLAGDRILPSRELAASEGLRAGSSWTLLVAARPVELTVGGILPSAPELPEPPPDLAVMDLPLLQELANRRGRIDRVEVFVEPGIDAAAVRVEAGRRLAVASEGRWMVEAPQDRRAAAATMTRAFRFNLTALSLIALLVGLFLIFTALEGAVVRRRGEIATLRSLGVEEGQIQRLWLFEAAALGAVGGALGFLLGWAGAQVAVRLVGRTVNALYFTTSVDSAAPRAGEFWLTMALAILTSVVAAWLPAREAAAVPPAQSLSRQAAPASGLRVFRRYWLGVFLAIAGVGFAWLPPVRDASGGRFPLGGYMAAFVWIFSGGILAGALFRPIGRALRALFARHSAVALVGLSHLRRPTGRHRLAVAAMLCAIAMTSAMAILVASFEATVRVWVDRALQADVYVTAEGMQSASAESRIPPEIWREVVASPEVEAFSPFRRERFDFRGTRANVAGADLAIWEERSPPIWVQAPAADWRQANQETPAFVTESFSERFRLGRGDLIDLPTPAGPQRVRIAGVFADYGQEEGSALVAIERLHGWFGGETLTSLALFLHPGQSAEAVAGAIRRDYAGLTALTNERLRSEVLRIFRQTFSLTYALEVIGVAVALLGLGLALASILLDRRNELTTLRALGWHRGELARLCALEGAVVSAVAAIGGILAGLALGWLLARVINKQSFGWTLGLEFPWGQLAGLLVVLVAAGGLVAYITGQWGARLPADREE